jgi:hypothetical protein
MNLVEYYRLLKRETQAVEDFLIAAKTVSAGESDLPVNALNMVKSDDTTKKQFEASFTSIQAAQSLLLEQIRS